VGERARDVPGVNFDSEAIEIKTVLGILLRRVIVDKCGN
jgi:hypothetical protein